jgi:hypothetical protein
MAGPGVPGLAVASSRDARVRSRPVRVNPARHRAMLIGGTVPSLSSRGGGEKAIQGRAAWRTIPRQMIHGRIDTPPGPSHAAATWYASVSINTETGASALDGGRGGHGAGVRTPPSGCGKPPWSPWFRERGDRLRAKNSIQRTAPANQKCPRIRPIPPITQPGRFRSAVARASSSRSKPGIGRAF